MALSRSFIAFALVSAVVCFHASATLLQQTEPTDRATIQQYDLCNNQNCGVYQCSQDRACNLASYNFGQCYSYSAICKQWKDERVKLKGNDLMPLSFYECLNVCRPENIDSTGNFKLIYECHQDCGKQKVPTYTDYLNCLNVCPNVCPSGDYACNDSETKNYFCEAGVDECRTWIFKVDAYKAMPAEFFQCDLKCRPNREESTYYYDKIYACKMKCAGLDINVMQ